MADQLADRDRPTVVLFNNDRWNIAVATSLIALFVIAVAKWRAVVATTLSFVLADTTWRTEVTTLLFIALADLFDRNTVTITT